MTGTLDRPAAPPAPATHPALGRPLALSGVSFRYAGRAARRSETPAGLGPLDLKVAAGEFLCVVGPSGSGKSTLLSLLAGFLRPQAGAIRVGDDEIRGPHPALTLVQQEPALFPWLTVAGNVAFGLRGVARPEQAARVADALRLVGLTDYRERRVHELSGGQRQRVSLARALAVRPGVLLLDEPFSALDIQTRTALADELLGIWWQRKLTVVFVTHHLDEALLLGQRVIALREGHVALDAPAKSLTLQELKDKLSVG